MTQVLVCWSGGCDSTLLLHHAAQAYSTANEPVRAISITSDQVTSGKCEERARKCLLKSLNKKGLWIKHTEVSITTTKGDGLLHYGLPQAVMWLLASQTLRENESLALGYIRSDDWPQHVESFQSVFDALQKVSGRTGNLWLPLLHTQKRGVLHQLAELDLLDLCWWCECPPPGKARLKPCGTCPSCQKHAAGLRRLEHHGPGSMWEGGFT